MRFGSGVPFEEDRREKQVPRRKCLVLHSTGDGPTVIVARAHRVVGYGFHSGDEVNIVRLDGGEEVIATITVDGLEQPIDVENARLAVRRTRGDSPVDVMVELDDRRRMKGA